MPEEKQIETLSELMAKVQEDMVSFRNGAVTAESAKIIKDYHRLLLKGAELNLQFMRLERGKRPEKELRLIPEKIVPTHT